MDVTIALTGSAALRPAWPRRAIAIARAGVAVVAVAASGDGSACPSIPGNRAISGAGACVFAVVMRRGEGQGHSSRRLLRSQVKVRDSIGLHLSKPNITRTMNFVTIMFEKGLIALILLLICRIWDVSDRSV